MIDVVLLPHKQTLDLKAVTPEAAVADTDGVLIAVGQRGANDLVRHTVIAVKRGDLGGKGEKGKECCHFKVKLLFGVVKVRDFGKAYHPLTLITEHVVKRERVARKKVVFSHPFCTVFDKVPFFAEGFIALLKTG